MDTLGRRGLNRTDVARDHILQVNANDLHCYVSASSTRPVVLSSRDENTWYARQFDALVWIAHEHPVDLSKDVARIYGHVEVRKACLCRKTR